jgi:ribosomal protein S18 acetylase RimI-like enzyme
VTRIRTASTDDVALLATLNNLVHDLHVRHRPDLFVGAPEQEAFFAAQIADPSITVLIAGTADGTAVGYALARVVKREGSALTSPDMIISLDQIAVSPDAARTGVGSALLEAVREAGRSAGCRRLVTDVWEFNETARAFYRASGLRPMNHLLDQQL